MSTAARAYVHGLVEENLGLPKGVIGSEDLPADLVDLITSAVTGKTSREADSPLVEQKLNEFLLEVKRYSLERDGFFAWKARWPEARPFAACLTHDVDNIEHSRRHILSTRRRFTAGDLILGLLGLRSLYRNIGLVAGEEGRRGFRSSFFLLTSNYSLGDLVPSITPLKEDGWEIGLHGDFGTHDSLEKMSEAVEKFQTATGSSPAGVREHYLRFDFEKTWQIMESVGFAYDTSVGARDSLGFPLGFSTPFHPPTHDWSSMKILEIPLVLMDTTLWSYLKLEEQEGMAEVERMIERVREVGGLFTLLWHQEAIRMRGGRLYPKILEKLAKMDCFVSSGIDVASWWESRSVPLVREGHEYRFLGTPPPGLRLHLEYSQGRRPRVEGGDLVATKRGNLVRVNSGEFSLRVE